MVQHEFEQEILKVKRLLGTMQLVRICTVIYSNIYIYLINLLMLSGSTASSGFENIPLKKIDDDVIWKPTRIHAAEEHGASKYLNIEL